MASKKSQTTATTTGARKVAAPTHGKTTPSPRRRRTDAPLRGTVGTKVPATSITVSPEALAPSSGDIALRAYFLFLERGAMVGNDLDDWFQAERELGG